MHPVALVQRAQPLAPTGGRTQSSHGPTPGVSAMEPSGEVGSPVSQRPGIDGGRHPYTVLVLQTL